MHGNQHRVWEHIPNKQAKDKTLETQFNEEEISGLPDKEFKTIVIKMVTKVRRTMYEQVKISTDRKYEKVTNRSHRTEEYDKNFSRGVQY